jgi:hypothetical protein
MDEISLNCLEITIPPFPVSQRTCS